MVTRAYFAGRFLALKLLRGALVAGALYDAALAALLVWRPRAASALLGPGAAGEPLLSVLAALWLLMLAGLGVAAARDFRRYSAVVATLVCGRLATAAALAIGAVAAAAPLPWAAVWSALLAVVVAGGWWPQRS